MRREPTNREIGSVRRPLAYYGGGTASPTIEGLRAHLKRDEDKSWWPEWFKTETGHLTKGGMAHLLWCAFQAAAPTETQP